jgi:photosystem II stability/assembly factor-like uncharacterized protein
LESLAPMPRQAISLLLALVLLSTPLIADSGDFISELPRKAFSSAPLFGADVRSIVFVPEDSSQVMAGTSAGHIYLSKDRGVRWQNAGPPIPFPGHVVAALHFDRSRPQRLWAGLWAVASRGRVVFSEDHGTTWNEVDGVGLGGDQVYSLATLPEAPGTLYAGTRSGVYRSRDDGATWRHLTQDHPVIETVSSLHLAAGDPPTLLAGTWRRAYRSDDGGETWRGVFEGMYYDTHVMTISPVPDEPAHLWASTCGWVYESHDLGSTWRRFQKGFLHRRALSVLALPENRLLAGTVAGVHFSTDGGRNWRRRSVNPAVAQVLIYDPADPKRVLAAGEGDGVWTSYDGGLEFERDAGGMINLRVGALLAADGELYAAVNFANKASGLYRLGAEGGRFIHEQGETAPIRSLVQVEGVPYAASDQGLYARQNERWQRLPFFGKQRIAELDQTSNGNLLVRTNKALHVLREDSFEVLTQDPGHRATKSNERAYPTGDPRFPRVILDRWGPLLQGAEANTNVRLRLPFPDGAIAAAAVHGQRLYVASTGYGLWWVELPG